MAVIAEIPVGAPPRTLYLAPDSKNALVANHGSATLSTVDLGQAVEFKQHPVGFMGLYRMTIVVRPTTTTSPTTALRTESQEILRLGLRMTTRACPAVTPRECPSVALTPPEDLHSSVQRLHNLVHVVDTSVPGTAAGVL